MKEILLKGVDGSNPLGFLAALGVLDVLSDAGGDQIPRLGWKDLGAWRPVITGVSDFSAIKDAISKELPGWAAEPAIGLSYVKGSDESFAPGAEPAAAEQDLKATPLRFRSYLTALVDTATATSRRSVDFAAAFASEMVQDNGGNTKPTAFHFTAGQQEFLKMVCELVSGCGRIPGVGPEDFDEALLGPWQYARALPVLQWDSTAARDYAFRARNPSGEKKLGVPGAEWLAFRGLRFMRVAPEGTRLRTTCCRGEWKTGTFRWPLWDRPIDRGTLQSLLGMEMEDSKPAEWRARGVAIFYEASILRSDQGGYGRFTPSRVAIKGS